MAFYEMLKDTLREVPVTTFADNRIRERDDLQRLLRSQIEIISKDTLVVAEEFGDWDGSNRRIDLLGIDRDANLIVIEIKRTEDGGHMELQALRYAAMVSTMTFEKVEEIYTDHIVSLGRADDARTSILDFLGWDDVDPTAFAQKVRIILISAEFGKELTTSVMWLNEQGLDIRCVRIKPYLDGGRILVDIQQIIPLPEATEYIVGIRKKQDREREARESSRDYTKYDLIVGGIEHLGQSKRSTILKIIRYLCESGVTPDQISAVNDWGARRLDLPKQSFIHLRNSLLGRSDRKVSGASRSTNLDISSVMMI